MMYLIVILQLIMLAVAVRFRVRRVEHRFPLASPTPQNGKSKRHDFTPALGTKFQERI